MKPTIVHNIYLSLMTSK